MVYDINVLMAKCLFFFQINLNEIKLMVGVKY